jgi:hypothetical protein
MMSPATAAFVWGTLSLTGNARGGAPEHDSSIGKAPELRWGRQLHLRLTLSTAVTERGHPDGVITTVPSLQCRPFPSSHPFTL